MRSQIVRSHWVTQRQIPEDSPLLDAATILAAQGRLDAAIATADKISAERALYKQAQVLKSSWISQKGKLRIEGGQKWVVYQSNC
ncbi:MAG: hypothetical protein F6J92_32360 [Symploca sp. SIO1A3]|nr:hypothetical protein [Symploca sp. SIO2C1]NER51282.1 hypothetical protein [Symploca sp. SIO1A3]